MRRIVTNALAAVALAGMLAAALVAWYVFSGTYNIAASEPHFTAVRAALDRVFHSSVREQAEGIVAPVRGQDAIERGARIYARECARCHSLPGGERPPWTSGLRPEPPHLAEDGTPFEVHEIFWLVRNGARMTGMPSWQHILSAEESWAVAAFVGAMPDLTPDEYQAMVAEGEEDPDAAAAGRDEEAEEAAAAAEATGEGAETAGQQTNAEAAETTDGPRDGAAAQAGDQAAAAPRPEQEPSGPAATVGMTNSLEFEPREVTIRVGETVLWRNTSDVQHTVTADQDKVSDPENMRLPEGAEPFDSGMLQPGEEWSHTFEIPGRYKYFCIPHEAAGMIGDVIVEE